MNRMHACAVLALGLFSLSAIADDPDHSGGELFGRICMQCHSDTPVPRAMTLAQMRKLPPEKIVQAQTSGLMFMYATALTADEKRVIAEYVSEIPWGSVQQQVDAERLSMCPPVPPLAADALDEPHWSGWGLDADNTHFQPAARAGLGAADLANLELKWSFGFPGATNVSLQPAVLGGRMFVGSPGNAVYALDAKSGCVYWKFDTAGEIRAAVQVARRADGTYAVYAADRKAWTYALDANTGRLLWKDQTDDHPWAIITGTPALHDGRLYVPVSSFEEVAGAALDYECCTFRGNVVAYDAATGARVWKSYVIPDEPRKTRKTTNGVQLWAPSGAALWSQPTVDPKAGVLYVTTGDSYSYPAAATSDAVVALDLGTGAIRWSVQMLADDAFTAACTAPNADPVSKEGCGPDLDFGSSAILRTLPDGKRLLLAGQKSGMLHALDPDADGAIVWQKRLSPGGVLGGIEWGFAADRENVYVPISDVWETKSQPGHAGGLYAVRIADGTALWNTPAQAPDCLELPGCNAGQPAAAALTPGVLFSGAMDGHMRAYDPATGGIIWDYDTKREFDTVNEVKARGGSIKGAGVTVVDGWVYFGSGYGFWGLPGNVFLAFGPK